MDESKLLGGKIRLLRTARKMRLNDLAEIAQCSESMLSKIENGKGNPSLKTLHRIAKALDVTVSSLFSDGEQLDGGVVFRKGKRPLMHISTIRSGSGVDLEALIPHESGHLLQSHIHILAPGASTDGFYTHEGEEVGYVLEGKVELYVDGNLYHLEEGDSFVFDSRLPHGYSNPGSGTTRILWVNTPPTF